MMAEVTNHGEGHWSRHQSGWWPAAAGGLLIAIGGSMLAERLGLFPSGWRSAIWPVLLMLAGAAMLLRPTRHGREGLFFVLAGAWWYAGLAGWLSFADTWPLLVVFLGASLVLQSLTTPPRDERGGRFRGGRESGALPLVLVAILAGALLSGRERGGTAVPSAGTFEVMSFMGMGETRREPVGALQAGHVVSVMGRSTIDLRQAAATADMPVSIDGVTLMAATVIYVPDDWNVDLNSLVVFGRVRDERRDHAAAAAAPRLRVRGAVLMGALVIRSAEPARRSRS